MIIIKIEVAEVTTDMRMVNEVGAGSRADVVVDVQKDRVVWNTKEVVMDKNNAALEQPEAANYVDMAAMDTTRSSVS